MPSLLIVDDDPSIRTLFTKALQHLGQIEVAPGGAEAIRVLGQKRFDCILVDLHMPVIDGFVVLHMLSKPGVNHDTPVYVVTADTSDEARVRALRRHAVFLLTKPVPLAMLSSLVEATLAKSASRRPQPPSVVPKKPAG